MPHIAARHGIDTLIEGMKSKRYRDPVVEAYMPGVDRTLLRENLKLTFEGRARKHASALAMVLELRRAGRALRMNGQGQPRR
jgi:hypothetical protein